MIPLASAITPPSLATCATDGALELQEVLTELTTAPVALRGGGAGSPFPDVHVQCVGADFDYGHLLRQRRRDDRVAAIATATTNRRHQQERRGARSGPPR